MSNTTTKKPKAGRPKGAKDNRPRITQVDIDRAKMMFITGASISQIKKALNLKSANVLYKYIDQDGWEEAKDKYLKEREDNYLKMMMEKSIKETDDVLADLKTIKTKAIDGVVNMDVDMVKFGEASQAYLSATEMERKVKAEGIELGFISVVAKVLKECIQDPKILAMVADKLRVEFENYQGRPLLKQPDIKIIEG